MISDLARLLPAVGPEVRMLPSVATVLGAWFVASVVVGLLLGQLMAPGRALRHARTAADLLDHRAAAFSTFGAGPRLVVGAVSRTAHTFTPAPHTAALITEPSSDGRSAIWRLGGDGIKFAPRPGTARRARA